MNGTPHKILQCFLCLLLYGLPRVAGAQEEVQGVASQAESGNSAAAKLKEDMRKLWTDLTVWTRSYIVSAAAGLEDQRDVVARLLKNQEDIGNAFKPYYGDAAGSQLTKLLNEHLRIAEKVVEAAKNQQQVELKNLYTDWYQNADDIADLLSSLNMNWTLNELRDMLHAHLQQMTDVVDARLKKDGSAEIAAFDQGEDNILLVADTLTEGIVKQFPQQFSE